MSSYRFNSIVNQQEADALKDMIFKRVRERAESLTKDTQDSYTSAIKNDIMDLARDTFVSSKNPFSITPKSEAAAQAEPIEEHKQEKPEIGFQQRKIADIKAQIANRNKNTVEEIANNTVNDVMADAGKEFTNKTSFMGALNFLNSQASISLISKKGKSFEALA